ncbi:hypothetical protein Tco_0662137 [Tanacetum coccineum]
MPPHYEADTLENILVLGRKPKIDDPIQQLFIRRQLRIRNIPPTRDLAHNISSNMAREENVTSRFHRLTTHGAKNRFDIYSSTRNVQSSWKII